MAVLGSVLAGVGVEEPPISRAQPRREEMLLLEWHP